MTTDISVTCPRCKSELEAPAETAGTQVECPSCQHTILIPSPTQPARPAGVRQSKPAPSSSSLKEPPPTSRKGLVIAIASAAVLLLVAGGAVLMLRKGHAPKASPVTKTEQTTALTTSPELTKAAEDMKKASDEFDKRMDESRKAGREASDLVEAWLADMKAGKDTKQYWENTFFADTLNGVKSWKIVSAIGGGDTCQVTFEADYSTKKGQPINSKWVAFVTSVDGKRKLSTIRWKEPYEKECRKVVGDWLDELKSGGHDTSKYWKGSEETLYAVTSWKILSVEVLGDDSGVVSVRVESSTKAGIPIRKDCRAHLSYEEGKWRIYMMN